MRKRGTGTCASPTSELAAKLRLEGYYPISEVANHIGVHYSTVNRWVKENIVEFIDFGGAYYVKWTSVLDHLGTVASVLNLDKEPPHVNTRKKGHKQDSQL